MTSPPVTPEVPRSGRPQIPSAAVAFARGHSATSGKCPGVSHCLRLLLLLLLLLRAVCRCCYPERRHPDIWPQPDSWLPQRWIPSEAAAAGLTTRTLGGSNGGSNGGSSGGGNASKGQPPFLPFSTGPRGCIGRSYALLQMVLTLAVLLGSGVRWGLAPGHQEPQLVKSMTMHVNGGVWLVPHLGR
jgi:hypothetical protein